jgi:hypothetical protein
MKPRLTTRAGIWSVFVTDRSWRKATTGVLPVVDG